MPSPIARLVESSRRHAAIVAAAMLIITAAAGWFTALHVRIDTDVEKLISPDLPWRRQEAALDRAFPQDNDLLVAVLDAATPDEAGDAAAALAARLASEKGMFMSVRRPDGGEFFTREGLLFLPQKKVQQIADQLTGAQPLIGPLAADPSLRGVFNALGLMCQGVIMGMAPASDIDPMLNGAADAVEAALAGRHRPLSWQGLLTGREPGPDELRRFILTQPVLDYDELEPGQRASSAIHDAARALGLTPENGVRVRLTGPVALSDAQFSTLSQGAGMSTALTIGLLCLWLLLALRSVRLAGAILVTLVCGLVLCAAFGVAAVGAFNPISVAFAVLFVGIAIDFGIQFSVRFREERARASAPAEALRETARGVGGPLAVAAAATAAGFLAFVPTDYTGVSQLGLIAGVGMVIALVLNLTLLPALLALLRPRAQRGQGGFPRFAGLDRFMRRRRRPVASAAALLALGCLALLPRLSFDFNPLHLQNPKEEAVATLFDLMKSPRTTPYRIDILAPTMDAAGALATRIETLPEVAQVVTAASFVPDDQPPKIAALRDVRQLYGPTLDPPQTQPPPTDADIMAAMKGLAGNLDNAAKHGSTAAARLKRDLDAAIVRGAAAVPAIEANLAAGIKQRLDDLRLSLDPQRVSLATLPADLRADWISPDGRARIEVFPKGDARDNAVLRRFVAAVRAIAPDATGSPVTIQESARTVTNAFLIAGSIAIVAVAALLFVVLRRPLHVALALAPLLLAGLLTLATSVLARLPINFANIIALPLLLGIGVAFDIYFVMRWRSGRDDLLQSSTARAILFSAFTTGTAFGSLAFSNYPGTADMGKLLMISLGYTVVCTFFVLPALLGLARRQPSGGRVAHSE